LRGAAPATHGASFHVTRCRSPFGTGSSCPQANPRPAESPEEQQRRPERGGDRTRRSRRLRAVFVLCEASRHPRTTSPDRQSVSGCGGRRDPQMQWDRLLPVRLELPVPPPREATAPLGCSRDGNEATYTSRRRFPRW
jgi:hypothetical protein